MTHFTVLVVTKSDCENELKAALQPYHEFECTGVDDQYVQDVDITDEIRDEFNTGTTRRLRAPDGSLHEPYEDRFYRDPTPEEIKEIGQRAGTGWAKGVSYTSKDWGDGRGYRAKVSFIPDGWIAVDVPRKDVGDIVEWACDYHGKTKVLPGGRAKHGWIEVDHKGQLVRAVDRTNPDKKWDWWTVGGRWSGSLLTRDGKRCDQARKADVDFAAMLAGLAKDAGEDWDAAASIINGESFESWDAVSERLKDEPKGIEKAREIYWAQPVVQRLKENDRFSFRDDLSNYLKSREQFVRERSRRNLVQFAVLVDGKWHERGEMGWWATVRNEKGDWEDQYEKLVASVPDDRWLTVVDCHI